MKRKELLIFYGQIAIILLVFVFISGVIAAPIFPTLESSVVAASNPPSRLPIARVSLKTSHPH